jgi:hypothetical protein
MIAESSCKACACSYALIFVQHQELSLLTFMPIDAFILSATWHSRTADNTLQSYAANLRVIVQNMESPEIIQLVLILLLEILHPRRNFESQGRGLTFFMALTESIRGCLLQSKDLG